MLLVIYVQLQTNGKDMMKMSIWEAMTKLEELVGVFVEFYYFSRLSPRYV
jgi:hypothetical protein